MLAVSKNFRGIVGIENLCISWIKKNFHFNKVNDHKFIVNTDYMDAFNDSIGLTIIKQKKHQFKITDEEYTLWNLKATGIELGHISDELQAEFTSILTFYSVIQTKNEELYRMVNEEELVDGIREMVKAIQEITSLHWEK